MDYLGFLSVGVVFGAAADYAHRRILRRLSSSPTSSSLTSTSSSISTTAPMYITLRNMAGHYFGSSSSTQPTTSSSMESLSHHLHNNNQDSSHVIGRSVHASALRPTAAATAAASDKGAAATAATAALATANDNDDEINDNSIEFYEDEEDLHQIGRMHLSTSSPSVLISALLSLHSITRYSNDSLSLLLELIVRFAVVLYAIALFISRFALPRYLHTAASAATVYAAYQRRSANHRRRRFKTTLQARQCSTFALYLAQLASIIVVAAYLIAFIDSRRAPHGSGSRLAALDPEDEFIDVIQHSSEPRADLDGVKVTYEEGLP